MDALVWMVGAGGRTPFVGAFRGARPFDRVRLAWAGRIAGSAGVLEGWAAAEAARDALADAAPAGTLEGALGSAAEALARLDARWRARGDLSVLLVATDGARALALGSGLAGVRVPAGADDWRPLVPDDHPILGEPGVPSGPALPLPLAARYVALPIGARFPTGDVAAACGAHG